MRLPNPLSAIALAALLGACRSGSGVPAGAVAPVDGLDRTVLPVHEPVPAPITVLDARDAKAPPRFEVKAPEGAPNVVIVLIDDIGFGHSSAFGGPIAMPTLDKLAEGGLRYNRFHTTALCSPTRVALLTGRNHHVNNAGAIMELATARRGQYRRMEYLQGTRNQEQGTRRSLSSATQALGSVFLVPCSLFLTIGGRHESRYPNRAPLA